MLRWYFFCAQLFLLSELHAADDASVKRTFTRQRVPGLQALAIKAAQKAKTPRDNQLPNSLEKDVRRKKLKEYYPTWVNARDMSARYDENFREPFFLVEDKNKHLVAQIQDKIRKITIPGKIAKLKYGKRSATNVFITPSQQHLLHGGFNQDEDNPILSLRIVGQDGASVRELPLTKDEPYIMSVGFSDDLSRFCIISAPHEFRRDDVRYEQNPALIDDNGQEVEHGPWVQEEELSEKTFLRVWDISGKEDRQVIKIPCPNAPSTFHFSADNSLLYLPPFNQLISLVDKPQDTITLCERPEGHAAFYWMHLQSDSAEGFAKAKYLITDFGFNVQNTLYDLCISHIANDKTMVCVMPHQDENRKQWLKFGNQEEIFPTEIQEAVFVNNSYVALVDEEFSVHIFNFTDEPPRHMCSISAKAASRYDIYNPFSRPLMISRDERLLGVRDKKATQFYTLPNVDCLTDQELQEVWKVRTAAKKSPRTELLSPRVEALKSPRTPRLEIKKSPKSKILDGSLSPKVKKRSGEVKMIVGAKIHELLKARITKK